MARDEPGWYHQEWGTVAAANPDLVIWPPPAPPDGGGAGPTLPATRSGPMAGLGVLALLGASVLRLRRTGAR